MLIYRDAVTGSELFSDTYKVKLVDNCLYEVDCEIKLYDKNDSSSTAGCGFNPSAEGEEDEGTDDNPDLERKLNVAHENRLDKMEYTKKNYQLHLKDYFKYVKAYLAETDPGRVDGFVAEAKVAASRLIKNFKDLDFFIGETHFNGEKEGMAVPCNYRDDGITPFLTFWKDGLIEEKV